MTRFLCLNAELNVYVGASFQTFRNTKTVCTCEPRLFLGLELKRVSRGCELEGSVMCRCVSVI